ncbi:hypothetical protein AMTRI_Chr08g165990 [Amborella trichopoda]
MWAWQHPKRGHVAEDMDIDTDEDGDWDDEETDGAMENHWQEAIVEDWTSLGDFGLGATSRNVVDWQRSTTAKLQTPPGFTQIIGEVNPNSETQEYPEPIDTLITTSQY